MRSSVTLALFSLLALAVWAEAALNTPQRRSAVRRSVDGDNLVAARQVSRSRVVGRLSEKGIIASAAKRAGALRPRASVEPAPPYVGPETTTRTYATYLGWDNAYNDLSADGVGPSIRNVPTFQLCINQCNQWKTNHPSSVECTGISYDAPAQLCWVKGVDYNSYQFVTKSGTRSLMVGTCDFWNSAAAPKRVPAGMAAVCQQLNAS